MNPRTQEFLYFLLWSADRLSHPTFRNLTDSYEAWAYRAGLWRQVAELEKRQWLERRPASCDERIYRLTEAGRLIALGGRDPEARWTRAWDGRWRLVIFDVPVRQNARREELRRYLRARAFGYLQKSVWITPDPSSEERAILAGGAVDVKALILLEARPCAGESDAQVVAAAWNFEAINRRYARHLKVLARYPSGPLRDHPAAVTLQRWATEERRAWMEAVGLDPLLPERLLPSGYLGQQAWRHRIKVFHDAGQEIRNFIG